MTARGYGIAPFGMGVWNYGVPYATPIGDQDPNPIRALTRSGDLSPNSRTTATQQGVAIVLGSRLGSSIVLPQIGVKYPPVIAAAYQRQIESAIRVALRGYISRKLIRLVSVTVEVSGTASRIAVEYLDNTSGGTEVREVIS